MSDESPRRSTDRLRRRLPSRRACRIGLLALLVAFALPVAGAFASGESSQWSEDRITERSVAPAGGVTVISSDAYGGGRLMAYRPNGSVLYYNQSYDFYHDVDPEPNASRTVLYVASENVDKGACDAEVSCRRSVVERLNLSTGAVTRLWSNVRPRRGSSAIHDVDRDGPNSLLVGEISRLDGAYVVNTSTGIVEWNWRAQQRYPLASGGNYPSDWTHINDVERLPDGRVMVSVRNQDQIAFVDPETGVRGNWTLGADDRHSTLFEQHNPDYIPDSQGGPAVLIADSENNRIVEYQRQNGSWTRSWTWSDPRMEWPRDADRLPNGHTLVTDTNSDRVLEVNREGDVVWSVSFPGPYEAERLGTGDESANGSSAAALGLESRGADGGASDAAGESYGPVERLVYGVVDLLPTQAVHGLLYLLPAWLTPLSAVSLVGFGLVAAAWALLELRWSRYGVSVSWPIRLRR